MPEKILPNLITLLSRGTSGIKQHSHDTENWELETLAVVIMTTTAACSDYKVGIMTTLSFQCDMISTYKSPATISAGVRRYFDPPMYWPGG